MNKFNYLFALLLGALVSFTSCDKDDDLSPEELEAKQTEELIETITANFDAVTTKKWSFKEFQPSADMLAASTTPDGYLALTRINDAKYAKDFNMVISFTAEGNEYSPKIAMNVPEEELEAKVLNSLNEPYGFEVYTELTDGQLKSYLAQFRRVVASPFAADDLTFDQITSEESGLCIFKIEMTDFSKLSYEDLVLSQKKLIKGNSDKIYVNEDGTLTVETTDKNYGVSKMILEEVIE